MKFTEKALELMRKFSAGVSCPKWDESNVEERTFYTYCADIARKTGKNEIDEEVAKEYILMVHNRLTHRVGMMAHDTIESIENCMARPRKIGDEWVCVHGKEVVMTISKDEAEFLEQDNKKILKSS
jgi:hypothetical protein